VVAVLGRTTDQPRATRLLRNGTGKSGMQLPLVHPTESGGPISSMPYARYISASLA